MKYEMTHYGKTRPRLSPLLVVMNFICFLLNLTLGLRSSPDLGNVYFHRVTATVWGLLTLVTFVVWQRRRRPAR